MAGRLLQESGRRQISMVNQSVPESSTSPQTAFTAQRVSMATRGGRGRQGRGRGGYRWKGREVFGPTAGTELRGNSRVIGVQSPQSTKCHYCGKTGHWKKDCYKKRSDEAAASMSSRGKEFTFLAEDYTFPSGMGWIIDSGASQHISNDRVRFTTYTNVREVQAITIADGTRLAACGMGNIEISTKAGCITLTDVWHVPTIETSLISVARMVDAGFTVAFSKLMCSVSKEGKHTELGRRYGTLYHLNTEVAAFTNSQHLPNLVNLGLTTNQSSSASLDTWHRRLCHRTLNDTALSYISARVTDMRVSDGGSEGNKICGICARGRQHKEVQTKAREKPSELLSVVHSDICGPMQTTSLTGERYFVTFTDEMSGRVSICLLQTKDGVLEAFQAYRARAEKSSGKEIKAFRTDGGGEYLNGKFKTYLKQAGIQHIISPPYSPQQNGLAERMNRTIMESARCMLEDTKLDKRFWGYAVLTAAHIHNRLPSRSHDNLAPLEHWTGKAPAIGHLRIFGSTAWVHVPKETRQKLDPKSVKCVLVGYEEDAGSRVYKLYDTINKKTIISRDVIIDESQTAAGVGPAQTTAEWEPEQETLPQAVSEIPQSEFQPLEPITPQPNRRRFSSATDIQDTITLRPRSSISPNTSPTPSIVVEKEKERELGETDVRRSQRNRHRELFRSGAHFALMAKSTEPEPQTLTEALSCSKKVKWKAAWEAELTALAANNTWVLEPLPAHRTAIGCRWLFRKKEDGRYKARLVAKGYSQREGIDYQETFAPVAKFTTIRLLLALSCESDWEIYGMDVKTAFLNSQLEETVYMEIPEGISVPSPPISRYYHRPMACRLLKSIYGLKQSPRAWYGRINKFFLANNFIRSDSDHSLFINYEKPVILLLYVDDIVLVAPTKTLIDWIRSKLEQEFDMTDLGELQSFLGLEIKRNRKQRTLYLSQSKYIQKILDDHGMLNCNPATTPADTHIRLGKTPLGSEATESERRRYQSAVGSLMYAMLGTRPDLAYAVSTVSQFSTNPNASHWTAVKRVFRYLAGTVNRGLYYGIQGNEASGTGFTDADWGGSEDRKSIGGYTFVLNGAAVSWNSKKQSTVALSSTEAEYMALTQAVKESLWLQAILQDLGANKHAREIRNIYIDNQGAMALARNPEYHARTKHIDIQYHFIREHVENRRIELTYCPTTDMTADIFTKALPQPAFTKHNLGLGLTDQSIAILATSENTGGDTNEEPSGASTSEGRYCVSPALTPWSPDIQPA